MSRETVDALVALGFGASLISIFARLGGGIFTKGADVGADLVGKVEAGIPEDDPRNPATIADNVGDNVGDCAGMAADLFETYAVTVVATMVLASIYFAGAAGPAARRCSIRWRSARLASSPPSSAPSSSSSAPSNSIMGALYKGLIATGLLSIVGLVAATTLDRRLGRRSARRAAAGHGHASLFFCGLVGLVVTGLIVVITEYYTGTGNRPVRLDRPGLGHRPWHQCHPGPRGLARIDGAAGAGHRRRHHRHLVSSPACSASRSR